VDAPPAAARFRTTAEITPEQENRRGKTGEQEVRRFLLHRRARGQEILLTEEYEIRRLLLKGEERFGGLAC
jgi:hypothetical protein